MLRSIRTLQDVVDWGLCIGCGACYYACSNHGVSLVNIKSVGIRPRFDSAACASCSECLSICPGYFVDGDMETSRLPKRTEADHEFGPALEIWEGHASDPEIRYRASSGGILSALAFYCLEQENMAFVLHAGMDEATPWLNKTVQSRTRSEILARCGSRYAPASPCEGLGAIEQSNRPCVFIGKPCDAAAVGQLRRKRPDLDRNLGLVLTFFCAGTPSTQGTLDLLKSLDLAPEEIDALRYRGEGWPGRFKALYSNRTTEKSLSYMESWGRLTGYRPLRCHLCPDGLGRVADISCGDAWEEFGNDGNPGRSIVVVRTRRGQEILHRAIAAKYVELKPVGATAVLAAQPSLLQRRRELFGRLLAMQLLLIPIPKFAGFSLFRSWISLPFTRKLRTVLGTAKRSIRRGGWRRQRLFLVPTDSSKTGESLVKQASHKRPPHQPKIWIDLDNSPHVPFFAPIIEELEGRGYSLFLTARDCFQVCQLADLIQLPYKRLGRHYGKNKLLKLVGLVFRAFQLLPSLLREKPDLALSHGSRSQLLVSALLGIPSLIISDYEFAKGWAFIRPTWVMVPEVIPDAALKINGSRVLKYPGIKEDVYVHNFRPDPSIRAQLGLSEEEIVVTVRPPADEAHYHSPRSDELFRAAMDFLGSKPQIRLVVLPRNQRQANFIRQSWPKLCTAGKIIIPQQVVDGPNLIWHSDLVISGGGTMNREAAALGVPVYSIFRGKIGAVDRYLAQTGQLVLLETVGDMQGKLVLSRRHRPGKPKNADGTALRAIIENVVEVVSRESKLPPSKNLVTNA